MTTLIDTESGARYEFDGGRVRRVNPDHNKRGDGEWQVLVSRFPETPVVGSPMVLVMESLSRYGEDDYGTSPEFVGDTTTRTTTPVVRMSQYTSRGRSMSAGRMTGAGFVPNEDAVRIAYSNNRHTYRPETEGADAEFYRWLAEHDAETLAPFLTIADTHRKAARAVGYDCKCQLCDAAAKTRATAESDVWPVGHPEIDAPDEPVEEPSSAGTDRG